MYTQLTVSSLIDSLRLMNVVCALDAWLVVVSVIHRSSTLMVTMEYAHSSGTEGKQDSQKPWVSWVV